MSIIGVSSSLASSFMNSSTGQLLLAMATDPPFAISDAFQSFCIIAAEVLLLARLPCRLAV